MRYGYTEREYLGMAEQNSEKAGKYRSRKESGSRTVSAPICDFVRAYAESGAVRMHMPGHKGRGYLGAEALDITEISGADALYEAAGIIRESEENAAKLFGTKATFYGTEGSSQMIRAMLCLTGLWAREKDRKERQAALVRKADGEFPSCPNRRITILAARNVHKSFVQACALLDYDVEWLYGEETSLLSCRISPETLENALKSIHRLPDAFYITSPDYLGKTADIRALSDICHCYGIPFLVDNAHGAYLHFLKDPQHPMDLGADLCCDSAHKTFPVLTGGAYLHVAKERNRQEQSCFIRTDMLNFFSANAKSALSLFGSTSPSYLILQSLDGCNQYLAEEYREKLAVFTEKLAVIKQNLRAYGFSIEVTEPLKLTIRTGFMQSGENRPITGGFLAEYLRAHGIECEFSDPDYLVLMPGPENTDEELRKTSAVLQKFCGDYPAAPAETGRDAGNIPEKEEDSLFKNLCLSPAEQVLPIREAVFSPHEIIPVSEALGRIAASPAVSCPPAVPIVVSGERITETAVQVFRYYGIDTVEAVRE